MSVELEYTEKSIRRKWRAMKFSEKVGVILGDSVRLNNERIICLKDSYKSMIWTLEAKGKAATYPLILKIFKNMNRQETLVEWNMYQKASKVLQDLIPDIYFHEPGMENGHRWICMEHVRPIRGRITFKPEHFLQMIPSLAELHARTYNDRFQAHQSSFAGWLPQYESKALQKERLETNEMTLVLLDEAMEHPELREKLSPYYAKIEKILLRGPNYFPEVVKAGQCIVHSDLQTTNMGCHDLEKSKWDIKFLDWEGAKYAPCWLDVVNMVGIFFAYRKDCREFEDIIVPQCAEMYANEMKKRGIVWKEAPYRLYQMAYLQRILEKGLYLQLHWEVNRIKKGVLLAGFIDKINRWGKEFALF